ncbi:polymerase [Sporanaerobium hydrogeniformans]|uniref:Polymerase n=1 Tax=Sporanaerobium hydrogeniformans TaxID=3072179 RepID=A0AC61DAU0_9FIRM|nr:O-antigen ligase family protein [Sporanaerobium hydrogeniformans]PHV70158.1 polymerase [Sporanaerobium hydrogeniformans]
MSQTIQTNQATSPKRQTAIKKGIPLSSIPTMLLLGIVPLITRLKVMDATEEVKAVFKQAQIADFFSYHKATFILLLAVTMLVILFFSFSKEDLQKYKELKVFVEALGGFLVFSLLSTFFSPYKETALWGVPGRMEGMLMIGAYGLMMLYAIYSFKEAKHYTYIIISLSFLVGVLTFLGIFEYVGHNLLSSTDLGLKLLFPAEYEQLKSMLQLEYTEGKVYGTLYHYNYMGSFGALMVPLFATLCLYLKDIKAKVYCGFFMLCSLFLLFGSTSRGGLIGVALAFAVAVLIFSKNILKNWKFTLPVALALVVVVVGLNVMTGGTIFERIPSLIKDIGISLSGSDQDFDYKDHIPVRDITCQDGKAILVTQTDELHLQLENGELKAYDQNQAAIKLIDQGDMVTLADERFSLFTLTKVYDTDNNWAAFTLVINGRNTFVFRMNDQEGVYMINSFTQEKEDIAYPETFGFQGKERLGSARGYIWSRSIPMLKNTLFIGHGPDTYPMEFPQNDYLGKYYAYNTPNMIVDKPHNLYLQIGINQGIVALVGFLVLVGAYIIQSLRLYIFKRRYVKEEIIGIATMLSVVGYLGAGLFNDSVISVAPIFWILLGIGLAINNMNKKIERA